MTRTRIFGAAVDAALLLTAAYALMVAVPAPAYAYVDPSVMTYTIQALAGVAVALSAVFGVAYRRLRKHAVRIFGIDENAGKVIDPDVKRATGAELESENERLGRFWNNAPKPGEAKELSCLGKLWRAALVSTFTFGTVMVLGPMELVVANSHSLTYGLDVVWPPIVGSFLLVTIIVTLVISFIRGKAFDIARAIVGALGVCFWLQALLLNDGLPQANGAAVVWGDYWMMHALSAIVWIAVFAGAIWYAGAKSKRMRSIVTGVASVFLVLTLVSIGITVTNPDATAKHNPDGSNIYITGEGIHTLSPSNNVVVFVLDMYDTKKFQEVYAQHPHMTDELTGFTFYPNATGSLIPTKYALPYLLTGSWPSPDDDFDNYLHNRHHRSSFLSDLHDSGYDLGIYTDTMGMPDDWHDVAPLTINQHAQTTEQQMDVDWFGTSAIMAKISLYRDAPWLLKPLFWYYTDDINTDITGQAPDINNTPYLINDVRYHDSLMREGLHVEDRGSKGSFRLIHLNGAHFPYTMNTNMQTTGMGNYEDQAQGAMNIVSDYLRQMKQLGIYDDATIIVTSDHGDYHWGTRLPEETTTPIMFVKPAQGAEANDAPMLTSNAQTGHLDFFGTVMYAATGKVTKYGAPAWEAPMEGRDRYFIFPDHNGKADFHMSEIKISGDALDFNSWQPDGVEWDVEVWNPNAGPEEDKK